MPSLLALKNRKKVIETIHRASSAMKAVASMRVRKLEKFIADFETPKSMIENVSSCVLEAIFLRHVMNKDSNTKAEIMIGCDSGMCGDFANVIKNYFTIHSKDKPKSLWILFGAKLESLADKLRFFYSGKISVDAGYVMEAAISLYEFIEQHKIVELTIHYSTKFGIQTMTILSKHMMEAAFIKNEELKNDIFQENKIDFDEICAGYGYFYLANKLYQVFLESMYQENRQRILAMTQAKTNAEDMGKIIDRLYNRARQEKITMELNEIASSVMEQ